MKSKTGAMEMSVGTIVTVVLLMSVLVLGVFLVRQIFFSATGAIDSINTEVESEIQKLFSSEGKRFVIYPTSRAITLKKGDDPKGFAFSVKNKELVSVDYTYTVTADDVSSCGSLSKDEANDYLIGGSGSFSLGRGDSLELPRLVKLDISETAPLCTMTYVVNVRGGETETGGEIFVTIK